MAETQGKIVEAILSLGVERKRTNDVIENDNKKMRANELMLRSNEAERSDYNQFQFLLLQVKTMENNLKEVDNISEATLIKELLDVTKASLEKLTTAMKKIE